MTHPNKKTRLTYITTELYDKLSWLTGDENGDTNGLKKIRNRTDYRLVSILKILHPLLGGSLPFGRLYYISGIRLKKSFNTYLSFCLDMGFIFRGEQKRGSQRYYFITEKGLTLLRLFY